jgi:hypothetical protein
MQTLHSSNAGTNVVFPVCLIYIHSINETPVERADH